MHARVTAVMPDARSSKPPTQLHANNLFHIGVLLMNTRNSLPAEDRLSLLSAIAIALQESLEIDERQARNIAAKTVGIVRQHYRGEVLYIARRESRDNRERDEAIRRDYDGSRASREHLMLKWDIRKSVFYEILKERPQQKA